MLRSEKENIVTSVGDYFSRSKASFVVDFKGLTVEQVTTLRKKLRGIQAEMKVVRNTLARRALAKDAKRDGVFKDQLTGTNAFVFAFDDVSATAKLIADFAKDNEKMQLKIGEMEGQTLDKKRIETLARLPSKDVLRAQFLGVLNAPATKFVGTLAAVPSGFARVLNAQKQKMGA
jgi:large subunit ribosomal protein L10